MIPSGSMRDLVRRRYVDQAGMLAQHEAAHAVVALYLGFALRSVTIDDPARDGGGLLRIDPDCRGGLLGRLFVVMAGPIGTGDPLEWRPLDVGDDSDETKAALIVERFDVDEDGWRNADHETRMLLELPHVARAWRAISSALYDRGTLDGADLKRLFDEAA